MTIPAVFQALEEIRREHDGLLVAADVVAAAKNESSILHDYFDWSDDVAANKWRMHQARELIRQCVVTTEEKEPQEVRCYLSLRGDEREGYYSSVSVMSDKDRRAMLLHEARRDVEAFERRYSNFVELRKSLAALKRAIEKML